MNGSIRAGNLFGIPFYINTSWFFVLALVTWSYGSGLAYEFDTLTGLAPWILGFFAALLLFASVLAHELGHSFAAIRQGIKVRSITLFLFGGLAALEKESDSPGNAFWVAIAGPAVSIVLFGVLTLINTVLPTSGPVEAILSLLAYLNLVLALFNLIPGLPLDGGNVLKALVWKITGNPYKGVGFASRVGQLFGWIAIVIGVLSVLGVSQFGSVWTILIGFFLLQNANRSAQFAEVQEQLDGLTAADAVSADSPIVQQSATLRQFADEAVLTADKRWRRFLVVNEAERLVGTIGVSVLQDVAREDWETLTVGDRLQPVESVEEIASDRPLLEVLKLFEEKQVSELVVLDKDRSLLGLLEKSSIVQLLQKPSAVTPA
ncbi:MAG: site-2 protease family protein [Leptolyngbyaceae cyanobacterium SL_1_1]|nr:site-2 protease family protein [Leptolyngbyaceae cyanobacterium RM1_1_2]NJO08311.1 site-2 protease family protein [Leptolyngbyaceae cyanobacterium SL_1_1]